MADLARHVTAASCQIKAKAPHKAGLHSDDVARGQHTQAIMPGLSLLSDR
jgi:hypothetical protein